MCYRLISQVRRGVRINDKAPVQWVKMESKFTGTMPQTLGADVTTRGLFEDRSTQGRSARALTYSSTSRYARYSMFSRISQVARHLARPRSNFGHTSAAYRPSLSATSSSSIMAHESLSANDRNKKTIHTAGCLIIGDEVLGGKTVDTNSAYMAKFCFKMGMTLNRVEVIGDDEGEITEAVRRMSDNYDFVVTSGGIGPT